MIFKVEPQGSSGTWILTLQVVHTMGCRALGILALTADQLLRLVC